MVPHQIATYFSCDAGDNYEAPEPKEVSSNSDGSNGDSDDCDADLDDLDDISLQMDGMHMEGDYIAWFYIGFQPFPTIKSL